MGFAHSWLFKKPVAGGGGTPDAPVNSIQYNNAGSFGGEPTLLTDGTFIVLGDSTSTADGLYSMAAGTGCHANGANSHAGGELAVAGGASSHAHGTYAAAYGRTAHAEGYQSKAFGNESHAEGASTQAGGAVQESLQITGTGGFKVGDITANFPPGDYVIYQMTGGTGPTSMLVTVLTSVYDSEAGQTDLTWAESGNDNTGGIIVNHLASVGAHSEGDSSQAFGAASHAEGGSTVASGDYAHAEGSSTTASGSASHAEGTGTTASGTDGSHAEGANCVASGAGSHAEGTGGYASGNYSHKEGGNGTASGDYSHCEGVGTTASGNQSHAEGLITTASGLNSHSEGNGSQATATCSHAEGSYTTAGGNNSHAMGSYSNARLQNQFAQASGSISESGDAQFTRVVAYKQTINNTPTTLNIGGSALVTIALDTIYAAMIRVVALGDSGSSAEFTRKCLIHNNAGTTALVGSVQTIGTDIGSNGGVPPVGWEVTITANNTNDTLQINVTGQTSVTINWVCSVELLETIIAEVGG